MKKAIYTFITTIAISITGFSQLQIGPVAGANFAMFRHSESVSKNTFLLGYSLGLKSNLNITNALSFQPALIWNSVGGKAGDDDAYTQSRLNYISVPLNLAYTFGGEDGNFQVFAGPYFGFGLNGKATSKMGGNETSSDIKFGSDNDKVNPVDYGLNLGLGYKLGSVLVNGGYMFGLNNLNNGGGDFKTYNSALVLNVTVLFGKN